MSTIRRRVALACSPLLALSLGCAFAGSQHEDLGFDSPRGGDEELEAPAEPRSFLDDEAAPRAAGDPELCGSVQHIPLRDGRRPLDVILVLDNSVSMALELDAVERSINRSFASILDESGADYRVILISRHRNAARHQTDSAQTAICITAPLSSLDACPAQRPGQTERFFHYDIDIDSTDSLSRLVDTFDAPDPYHVTEVGWGEWLREGSRKVFLEFTDDDSLDNGRDFLRRLMSRGPEAFGTDVDHPDLVFHSVIGVAEREPAGSAYGPDEPLVVDRCAKNGGLAPSSGQTYQALSRVSGGLRYPLCALDDYGAIFEDIARDGIRRSGVACSFEVPPAPAGKRLDTERIQLVRGYGGGDGTPLVRVDARDTCQPDAFYIEGDQIEFCPALCEQLADAPSNTVSVEFDCDSFVDVR
jgi:hypothetical protein